MGGRDGSDKRLLRGFGGTLEEVSLSDEARNRATAPQWELLYRLLFNFPVLRFVSRHRLKSSHVFALDICYGYKKSKMKNCD